MIETERIYIRPIQHTDANAIFAYRSLECVAQYQYWEPFTVQKSLEFVEQNSCADINAKGIWMGLAIILKSSNELIGDCALKIDGQSDSTQETIFSFIDMLKKGETIHEVPQALYALFRPSVQPYMISWFAVDPVVEIRKVTAPILIVQGDKDIQISIKDAELLHQASGNSTKIIIPNMNHVFKGCDTMDTAVQMPLYSNPDLKNVSQLSECVIEFINRIIAVPLI